MSHIAALSARLSFRFLIGKISVIVVGLPEGEWDE